MSQLLSCFKAYDIRGRVPDELNEDVAYRVGRAYATFFKPQQMVVGGDIRLSSPSLKQALVDGLLDSGVEVHDIGVCGTEEIYFATFHYKMDGGIVVTASHNPMDYNGMKLVQSDARPVSGDSGLNEVKALAEKNDFAVVTKRGRLHELDSRAAYIQHLLGYIEESALKPLKVVVNAGNGGAGLVIDGIEAHLPLDFIKINHEPDGYFPNGIPNPLLPERRQATIDAVIENNADLGIAWDGDFDRCFFFDETGRFIEGYYLVGLLAEAFLKKHPNEKIVHDPRLTWSTIDQVLAAGGEPVQSKTGHAFIKERMRAEDAIYGGEMSAHHYFRDFAYCDSGMIPWLLIVELLSRSGLALSALVDERIKKYPCSGEINFKVQDSQQVLKKIQEKFEPDALEVDRTDGLAYSFSDWRFNVRTSNTEPVLRLNVESRGNLELMKAKTNILSELINSV